MIVKPKSKEEILTHIHDNFEEIEIIKELYQNKLKVFENELNKINKKIQEENKIEILDFEQETVYEIIDKEDDFEKEINKYNKLISKINDSPNITNKSELKDNNTLLISEVQNKVLLPFKASKINEILKSKNNSYNNIEQIIKEKYTIPLGNYKNKSISRYRETFILMKEKEKASLMDSIDLALEMMKNVYLHPAIITACENLDQLDVYLDCLETNELNDFPFFEVKFELNE